MLACTSNTALRFSVKTWCGPAFRAYNYNPPRKASIATIIRYETRVLGNSDIGRQAKLHAECLGVDLTKILAADAIWVTGTHADAAQYGEPHEVSGVESWYLIVDLGREGALLLNPQKVW